MMTVITTVELPDGVGPIWDEIMTERMRAAEEHRGWLGGQLLIPVDSLNARVLVGVWESRSHWEAWHTDAVFEATGMKLDELGVDSGVTHWYETIYYPSLPG